MNIRFAGVAAAMVLLASTAAAQADKPTIVLVHGAFADSSSWNAVVGILENDGYTVVAAANPLRSVKGDARYVDDIVAGIQAPVVLVGHSYGGSVISAMSTEKGNVKALVYVAAFAPDAGESAGGLANKFPGATLGESLAPPVSLHDGGKDFYIQQDKFHAQFAADVPRSEARAMAAGQRPITESAINELSGEPAWKTLPSWFVFGDKDKNIPLQALTFMADRAHSKQTVVVKGSSHVVMVSNPKVVAKTIESAAASTAMIATTP
jgi:pimeloyl-ACP methyl ester carboxylesterase